jgi:hypothetical protein
VLICIIDGNVLRRRSRLANVDGGLHWLAHRLMGSPTTKRMKTPPPGWSTEHHVRGSLEMVLNCDRSAAYSFRRCSISPKGADHDRFPELIARRLGITATTKAAEDLVVVLAGIRF